MSLREKLKALEELQQIDLESNEVRGALGAIPAKRTAVEAAIVEARKAYDDEKLRLEGNERERRQLDSLLGMERDKVKKWEGRLGEIKTPREYAALSREIDIAKKSNETQSDHVKELTAQAGEIRKTLDAKADALSERELAAQGELQELDQHTAAAEEKLRELDARRAEAAKKVDPGLLAKYENIKRRRAGVAVAPVVGMTCKGCHRNIPPQLAITLQRANSIETCPNCHRIIYSADAVNPPAPSPA
ncbi:MULTISPECIES: zinc ribbon domain-containing protein [Anaeromyxobacter]|uniref:zinc ribbon domain-containing protein n=1 Tax=Anaeromyxobacter TaxID=161492 RepID=UPI001F59B9FC|nr:MULTISPECIES: C4-type zinc ribbon domain-containing protein [unclassified Anaeromyxobacter]